MIARAVRLAGLFALLVVVATLSALAATCALSASAHTTTTTNLININSGKCLDVQYASTATGAPIIQFACHDGANMESDVTDTGGGWHEIRFRHSGKCLDVPYASPNQGVQLWQYDCNGGDAQKFSTACSNCYGLLINKASGLCVDVLSASTADLAPVIQWYCHGAPNEQWFLLPPRWRIWVYPAGQGALTDYSHLHCKFHGACGQQAGGGLDWDSWTYTGALDGYFRAYTVNLGAGTQSPMADRSANFTSPSGCRYMELRIRDPVTGALQDAIAYIHTWTNSPGTSFTIASGWSQNYFTTMRADGGNCPWTGYHIHELSNWPYSILNGDIRFNGGVFGNYCIPYANHDPVNDTCLKLKNNDLANWSRYYDW